MKNIRESYKTYKANTDNPVDIKEFVSIANSFCKFLAQKILAGEGIKLPARTGTIIVKGKKPNIKIEDDGSIRGLSIDFKATRELKERLRLEGKPTEGKRVYHLNEHTNRIRYKFFWSKERMLVENKSFYSMIFTRTNKRKLASLIKSGKEYFVEQKQY